MRKFNFFIAALLLCISIVLTSCDDKEGHSLGHFKFDIATVDSLSHNTYALILDNGDRLWPAAFDVAYLPKSNQRVFVNYTILSDQQGEYAHYVKINDIWNILTKNVIELNDTNAHIIGNDPIKLNSMWIGGDYLNVDLMFNYGGVRPHLFNLVNNTLEPGDENNDVVELELRHNAYGSQSLELFEAIVCFNLKPFRQENVDSVNFSIKVMDWDGVKNIDLVYKYGHVTDYKETAQMPIPVITSTEYM